MLEMIYKGGPLVAALAFLSVLVVAFAMERFWVITQAAGKISPDRFLQLIREKLEDADIQGIRTACDRQQGSIGRVIKRGIEHYETLKGTTDEQHLKIELDLTLKEASAMEGAILERNMIPIATIGSIATMMGLLGTVIGMIRAFSAISARGEGAKVASTQLAQGIAEALVNTAGGLIVAIIAIICYNYFLARLDNINFALHESSNELVTELIIIEKEKEFKKD
ncbi:MAG: MotA/TolQ/ExbB proton channel family protein [Gammaproteobacteria bacterium]|nr:MotA/TolQ/ExbB proton channel family protein [Gammaproteobacteria bacterium]